MQTTIDILQAVAIMLLAIERIYFIKEIKKVLDKRNKKST